MVPFAHYQLDIKYMSKTEMPVAEAQHEFDEQEIARYELAYHVLPTVTDGEVSSVRDRIAAHITKAEGEIFDEETPQHFDLAYSIDKYLEGKHRKFTSAYFGWIRFSLNRSEVEALTSEVEADKELLRTLLIRLNKTEEAAPFYFHAARDEATKKVETVEERDIDPNQGEAAPAETADLADTDDAVSTEDDATTAASSEETKTS